MQITGMDIHRIAAEVVALLDGSLVKLDCIPMLRERLEAFARKEITHDDHVIVEATGNAATVAEVLAPPVDRIVIANPKQVKLIPQRRSRLTQLMRRCWPSSTRPASSQRCGFRTRRPSPSGGSSHGAPC